MSITFKQSTRTFYLDGAGTTDAFHINAAPAIWKLTAFIVVLGMLLVTMGIYRSPAVALMPDVTPKPLRSKGNAVINLMGAAGGILYLLIFGVLYSGSRVGDLSHVDYFPLFAIVAVIMAVSVLILRLTINEPKLVDEAKQYDLPEDAPVAAGKKAKLPRPPLQYRKLHKTNR